MALTTGLVASYNLEGSYNNNMNTGLYNGTVVGSVPFISGKIGQGVDITGANSIQIGKPLLANIGSMMLWCYIPSSATGLSVIMHDVGLWSGFRANDFSSNIFTAYIYSGSNRVISTPIIYDAWTHLAMTWNGTLMKFYVNGILIGSIGCGNIGSIAGNVHIGSPAGTTCTGKIDMVNVFQTEKTISEINQLMKMQYPFFNNKFFTLL